jgi:hypothetical protein
MILSRNNLQINRRPFEVACSPQLPDVRILFPSGSPGEYFSCPFGKALTGVGTTTRGQSK